MPARLIVHPSEGTVADLLLDEGLEHVVGREPGCDVCLDDDRVSRRHALLAPLGGGRWRLADLGSKNGTTLDGQPVVSVEIAGAAWLGFGGLRARFEPVARERRPSTAAGDLEEELRRRRVSLDLQRRLDPGEGLGPLLRRVLDSVLAVAGAERGFVVLSRDGGGLELAATAGLASEEIAGEEFSGSVGAVERAVAEGHPVVLSDAAADTVLGGRPSVVTGGIRALVCLPLVVLGRVLGAVYADSREPGRSFTRLDVDILEGFTSHAALALAVARLHREVAGLSGGVRMSGETSDDPGGEHGAPPERGAAAAGGPAPPAWNSLAEGRPVGGEGR